MRGDSRRALRLHSTHSLQGRLAVFLGFAFAFGWIVLSWDLSMSLDPHFQSTMYGWWFFMGGWVKAIASWTIVVLAWRRYLGRYDLIQDKHFHDLGKLCFAFTAFGALYLWGSTGRICTEILVRKPTGAALRLIEGGASNAGSRSHDSFYVLDFLARGEAFLPRWCCSPSLSSECVCTVTRDLSSIYFVVGDIRSQLGMEWRLAGSHLASLTPFMDASHRMQYC